MTLLQFGGYKSLYTSLIYAPGSSQAGHITMTDFSRGYSERPVNVN